MNRIRIALLAAAVGILTAAPAQAALPRLTGVVGPGFVITLKKGTTKVTSLRAGKYTLAVTDKSPIHNFRLVGPGVNVATGVVAVGPRTFTVTLQRAKTYRFLCDPHPTSMRGSFKTF